MFLEKNGEHDDDDDDVVAPHHEKRLPKPRSSPQLLVQSDGPKIVHCRDSVRALGARDATP